MTHQDSDTQTPFHNVTKPAFQKDPWDHDYYDFIDKVDKNLKLSGTTSDRPSTTDAPDNAWFHDTTDDKLYHNDPNNGWVSDWSFSELATTALSVGSDRSAPGLKFTEDPVSPVSFSSESSISFTTNNVYKGLLLLDDPENTATYDRMQVFGQTQSNYDTKDQESGTTYSGETQFRLPTYHSGIYVDYEPNSKTTRIHVNSKTPIEPPYSGLFDYTGPNGYTAWDVTLKDHQGYNKTGDIVVIGVEVDGNA